MTDDQKGHLGVILMLQADLDGEFMAREVMNHALDRAERLAAIDVLRIARAMRSRLTRHALPQDARRRLLCRLSSANKSPATVSMGERGAAWRE